MSLSSMVRREADLAKDLAKFKGAVVEAVREQGDAPGARPVGQKSACFALRVKDLLEGNLSPSTYSGECQAAAVKRKLNAVGTPTGVQSAILYMIEQRKIRFPDRDTVTLNPNTIQALNAFLE